MALEPFLLDDLPRVARWVVERALNVPAFRRIKSEILPRSGEPFERLVLKALKIPVDVCEAELALIPAAGPLVIVANHPHGALDGLVMADIVRRIRPDVRILANHLLARVPELRDTCFFVDPFDGAHAAARSRAGLRAAHLWLRKGGALVTFPSGEVAHRRVGTTPIDADWKTTVIRLAAGTAAPVAPAWIEGSNSSLFYAVGRIRPELRTALLGRELLKQRGRRIAVRIGHPIRIDAETTAARVRQSVERLSDPVAREVSQLPPDCRLLASGAFDVYCVEATRIPATLVEIGRLRERTYRDVGEGTGRAIDLDEFDNRYLHLFVWDREHRRVVGAYRLGRTDPIVASCGVEGLYTRTLFRYQERLFERLGAPAIELGRSFVRAEYQKNYSALLLLWRGIGEFIVRNPEYRFLFGPVSISARYTDGSHQLLIAFLKQNHLDDELADLVAAINPAKPAPAALTPVVQSVDDVDRLVAQTEADGKGVPVLLRQYLKLNARLLGFNVDPAFGEALDALMLVDLTTVSRRILARYLGPDGAARFLAVQRSRASCAA